MKLIIIALAATAIAPAVPAQATVAAERLTSFPARCPQLQDRDAAASVTAQPKPVSPALASARADLQSPSRESVSRAITTASQAVALNPADADAYVTLARAHAASQRYMDVPKPVALERSWAALSRALAIDPRNVDALQTLADQVIARNRDFSCARTVLAHALAIEPTNARVNFQYAQVLGGFGQFAKAKRLADKALALASPADRDFVARNAGRLRYMAGEYDWVVAHYARYLQDQPGFWLAHFYRSLALGQLGRFDEALSEARAALPDAPKGDAGGIGMLALAYVRAGRVDEGRSLLSELLARERRGEHVVEYRIAAVYQALGEHDAALQWLGKEIHDTDGLGSWIVWLNYDPVWNDLRKDRRFKALKKRAGW